MKEMLGGCCVCSDERGWTENPLVYCDGQGCTVAVHQACYGIVTVPTGPWFCRKCESQERSARVRCELCPSRDGALKRTDQAGWAHVVCALYIPEVRFGNVTTMEPIILQLIPGERFNKTCYICEEKSRGSRATVGACMQCNKTGCKQQFHVTCAQALGLLCEEAGNYLDNVKYCGYCQHHYSKLKKGGNVKTIPPYKPIQADNGSSDSSPEKEAELPLKTTTSTTKRKGSSSKSTTNTKNKTNPSPSIEINGTIDDNKLTSNERTTKDNNPNSGNKFTSSNFIESIVTHSESVFGNEVPTGSLTNQQQTSAKAMITNQQQQKSMNQQQKSSSSSSKSSGHASKKRKTGARTPTVPANDNSNNSISSEASGTIIVGSSSSSTLTSGAPGGGGGALQTPMNTVQPTVTEATSLSTNIEAEKIKKSKIDSPPVASNLPSDVTSTPAVVTVTLPSPMPVTTPTSGNSIVVSVPLTATSLTNSMQSIVTSAPTLYQQLQQSMVTTPANNDTRFTATSNPDNFNNDDAPSKRSRSQSTEKQDKTRKAKRGSSNSQPSLAQPPGPASNSTTSLSTTTTTSTSSVNSSVVVTTTKRAGRNSSNNPSNNNNNSATSGLTGHILPPPPLPSSSSSSSTTTTATTGTVAPVASIIQGPTLGTGHFSSVGIGAGLTMGPVVKDSPPSSPGSENMSSTGPGRRKRKSTAGINTSQNSTGTIPSPIPTASTAATTNVLLNSTKDEKDVKLFQNGISAPHMLGNQLNPTSTMAQKMSDTLNQELEAHSIFTDTSNSSNLVGPQLHSRVIASIRSSQPQAPPATSFSSVFSTSSNNASANALGGGAIPQTLDQLLERQWEQGSQFLMEQAQHFDIASLLSCLHQLRAENLRLEEHVNSLLQRRDHLLAVNARLAIPLTTQPSSHPNNIHPGVSSNLHPSHQNIAHSDGPPGGSSTSSSSMPRMNRDSRVNNTYMPHSSSTPMENGLPPDPSPPAAAVAQYPHRGSLVPPQPSPTTIRHSPAASNYHQGQSSNIVSPANANNSNIVRNSTPDPLRGVPRSLAQSSSSYMYQQATMSSSLTSNQIGSVHSLHNPHGPTTTSHHGPSGKPS